MIRENDWCLMLVSCNENMENSGVMEYMSERP